ncbi:MAG: GEVED domain-containing protein [Chitinophagales bacterium]
MQAQDVRTCWTNDYLEATMQEDPATAERMAAIEKHTEKYIDKLDDSQKAAGVITIPTVVHVIYNNSAQNISEAQIQSQMQVLNDDFRRQNADASNTPSAFAGVAADTEIEFCLASVDPNGNATTGITRTSTNISEFSTGSNCSASSQPMKFTSGGGKDAWATTEYLNMWICNLGGGILGYAQFPGSGCANTDGVVMGYKYFGTIEQAQAPFDGGRTTTHEVGHWLNLRHIWGDGNCSADDFVSDTPSSDAANYGCASSHVSCSSTDMVQNYMDYSDDACMNLFTAGQKARMQAVLASGGARASLANSAGCGNGGGGDPSYCASQGSNVADEWIQTVALGGINNNSGSNGGYQDFTGISTDLEQSSAYNITLTPGYTGTAYAEYWKVFIDFNQDLDFDDSGEMVYDAGSASTTAVSGTFTIPTSATLGNTRMRVVMKYTDGNDTAVPTACGSYAYGETEDYTVNITEAAAATCDATSGLSSNNITTSGATLSWNAVSGASYDVRYRVSGTSSWTTVSASSASYSLSGLSASTSYQFQVRVNCSNGVSSSYTSSASFTTAAPATCNATGGLSSSNITASGAALSWNAVSGASYDVRYRVSGTSSWTTASASSASYNASGLSNCTDYQFQVRVNCSNGASSSYSSSATFSTVGCSTGGITYCNSLGTNSSYFHISNVTLNSINNNSGDDGGYASYAAVSTELTTGDTYTVSATEGTTYNYNQDWRVWIDFDGDGNFEASELVLDIADTGSTTVGESFTVPSNAVLGTAVGMRVSMKYFDIPSASQGSCDTFTYGEVEDYTVTFVQGCEQASGLGASGITETTASLGWSAAGGAASYNVRYRVANTSSWTTASASGTSSNISGLSSCTNYEFQVQTVCGAGLSSAYSSSTTFSTTGCTNISYCSSTGENSSYFHVANVSVGSINNSTGNDGGYGNYANVITDLGVGNSYSISATEGLGTSSNYDQDWRVWIDFNGDGTFSASEIVLDVANTANTTVSANFTVPAGTSFGEVGMRVSMKYFNIPAASQDACDTFTYGEVEDYTVNLVEGSNEVNYCASGGDNSSYFHISNVSVGSLNNNSGDDGGYGNYTGISTTLAAGSNYTVSATEGTTYNYNQDWRVWIDFNGDGTFSGSEMVLDVADTGSTTVSSSFNVPASASGEVRMRVSMKYYDIPAASQGACDAFTYGEVEDYTINISNSGRLANSEKTMLATELQVFPNPATDFVNINFEVAETSEMVNISIYDISGRLVVAESKTAQGGVQSEQFNLSNFDEGYYIVKIETNGTVMTKRLVVTK